MLLYVLIVGAVGLWVYLKGFKPLSYWKVRGVLYVKPYPFVGNLGEMLLRRKHFSTIFEDLYNAFPDKRYFGIYQMSQPNLFIRDPDLLTQICIKEFDTFPNHQQTFSKEDDTFLGQMLIALQDKEWKEMRSTLSPVFTSSKMKAMYQLIQECASNLTNYFLNTRGEEKVITLEMKELFSKFSNDVIASVAFGVKCNSLEDPKNPFYVLGRKLTTPTFTQTMKTMVVTFFPKIMKWFNVRFFPEDSINFFKATVKDNMLEREKKSIIRPDLIHLLMEAKKGNLKYETSHAIKEEGFAVVEESNIGTEQSTKKILSDDECASQAMLFFFAGFETVSIAASFAAHLLAVNPDVQKKLQDEIDDVYKDTDCISYEQLLKMKYLDQVISETLRLYPPAPQTDRNCSKAFTIQPINPDEKPLTVEKGVTISILIIGMHMDPEFFPNPHKFDPDRFSEENKHNIKSNTYLPFGVGPRNCIGSRLALLEIKILFVELLRKFDIVAVEKTRIPLKLDPKVFTMLPEGGFWLGFQPRKP